MVDNPNAINQTVYIGGPASYTWTEIVKAVGKAIGQDVPVNYITFEQPVPLLPAGTPNKLKAMETFELSIDMSQTAPLYGVKLTSLDEFTRRFFARPAG